MNAKNGYWIAAGLLNLFTALLHTIGGQLSLVDPLVASKLSNQIKAEWIGAWHMVTIVLWITAYYLLRKGFAKNVFGSNETVKSIGILYALFGLPSIFSSLMMQAFAPQWILLMPIGLLALVGLKKSRASEQALA